MKLNYDCVKDILLFIENYDNLYKPLHGLDDFSSLDYSDKDKFYSLKKLSEAGYIDADIQVLSGPSMYVHIQDITWAGHQYLNSIR